MLSNLLDVVGYASLTYGAYVYGGRGAAAIVGGLACIVLSLGLDGVTVKPRLRRAKKPD